MLYLLFFLLFHFSYQINDDNINLSLNFKSNFTFSSLIIKTLLDSQYVNMSIDITSDINLFFLPNSYNNNNSPKTSVTYSENRFKTVTTQSFIKSQHFQFADNHGKKEIAANIRMHNVIDNSLKLLNDTYLPFSFFGLSRKMYPEFNIVN